MLAPIRWRWSKTARHWCQSPFLNIRLDKDEAGLPKVDVYGAWSVGTDCGEEILRFKTMCDVFKFLAVAGEEDGAGSWAIAATDYVALNKGWAVWCGSEWLIVAAVSW